MELAKGNSRKVMKDALKKSGILQSELAEKLQITQASISGNMNRTKMGIDVFIRMINAMGYSVVVGENKEDGFEPLWELENSDE